LAERDALTVSAVIHVPTQRSEFARVDPRQAIVLGCAGFAHRVALRVVTLTPLEDAVSASPVSAPTGTADPQPTRSRPRKAVWGRITTLRY